MLNPDAKFEVERELDRFVEDLKIMTVVTDLLFTGSWNPNPSEPHAVRYALGIGWIPSSR